jgi:divalent metal cation (Fe/Co/Zn/Cd) transporter
VSAAADPTAGTGRSRDVRAGVRIEGVTVVWMLVEAAVALAAGVLAGSVLLTAFGVDSIIELVAGGVLLWRLVTEAFDGSLERVERAERGAAWVTATALVLLCIYVVVTAGLGLAGRTHPAESLSGIGVSAAAIVVMPLLAVRKRRLAKRLGSSALRGDAACSATCACLAGTVLLGLFLQATLGWWWADSVAALALLFWLGREAREAVANARSGASACSCG